ncbi:MBL fold metallo-hydrolase [Pyrococcus abyssi]|uniref:Hydroxyacylglutathione hydrolase related (Glyoxalase II) n=1 Tax=Pyrococcus abyssi (strain GE5 / Orsay) TaxID=272844 RepID=Q9UZT9_PYRAB|nr:MBL fold metallo-hydrolase [Pyrococcus abyssi]CAB49967.1 Hydroxyacylglutathione hydrolase related (EC 3.1.2.6) (glyoxalase II) [Pyrococcus abyssi GE5]CCE70467.1 TPA: hydroxyacylglutathione hydrolase related (glyoxalase II) [Pyrococcus abyssi GE5]
MIPIIIKPNILMLEGVNLDSNVYFLKSKDELLIVDTGTGVYWNKYLDTARNEGWLENVSKVIIFNTHEHFDHVGGNLVFKEKLKVVEFASHKLTAKALEEGDDYIILSYYYGRRYDPHEVELKLEDGDEIKVGKVKLRLIHTPGHTRGSSCLYYEEERIMFTGDTVFLGTYGRTDLPTGNEDKIVESLELLKSFDVRLGLPGHGRVIKGWKANLERILRVLK